MLLRLRANEMAVGCRGLLVKLNEYLKSQQTNGEWQMARRKYGNTEPEKKKKYKKRKTPGENGTFVPRRHLALQKIFFH